MKCFKRIRRYVFYHIREAFQQLPCFERCSCAYNLRFIMYSIYVCLPIMLSLCFSIHSLQFWHLLLELFAALLLVWALLMISRTTHTPLYKFGVVCIPICFFFLFSCVKLISYYLQGESFNDRFFFHVGLTTLTTGVFAYSWLALLPMLMTVGFGWADWHLLKHESFRSRRARPPHYIWIGAALTGALLVLPNAPKDFLVGYVRYRMPLDSTDIRVLSAELQRYHVRIEAFPPQQVKHLVKASSQATPKNLILLYLESLEAAYLDESRFPELLPNIKRALSESLQFTNLRQFPGTGWTMAGIFASQCGMPLLVNGNDALYRNQSLQELTCLGDVLNKAGYIQTYMGGASLSFAGKGVFYQQHGYQDVLGFEELSHGMPDQNYKHGWGLYDDTLFDLALRKFVALANQNAPFNLTMLTIDTHHPKGRASASCPSYSHSDNTMLQAVHCTDALFGKLLDGLQQHPAYKDTLIFVMSDHLAMRNVAQEFYPPERKLLVFALNAGRTGTIDIAGSHFDLPQTLLELLSIRTTAKFPLGQSLLQKEIPERLFLFQTKKHDLLKEFLMLSDRTHFDMNVCDQDGLFLEGAEQHAIHIGGRRFIMSRKGGVELPEETLLVVKSSQDGHFEDLQMLKAPEADRLIQEHPESLYFILTKNASMPIEIVGQEQTQAWKWYFGNPSSAQHLSGSAATLEEIVLSPHQCREIIQRIRKHVVVNALEKSAKLPLKRQGERLSLIAHAGGGINGDTYTNSLEALNHNIEKGYTFFEIDLSLTSDNIPVCIHDWKGQYQRWFRASPPAQPPTLQEFLTLKEVSASYDLCTAASLIEWLVAHPQAILVTDAKGDNIRILCYIRDHFSDFKERVIPQIYQPEEYALVREMGYKHIIWTLYRYDGGNDEVISHAKEMSLFAITMSTQRVNAELISELYALSIPIYVHTINNIDDAKKYIEMGVHGFYTDTLTDEKFE